MARNPNPLPPNATLTFSLPYQADAVDDYGNPTGTVVPIVVKAYLKRAKGRTTDTAEPGTHNDRFYVEGYVLETIEPDTIGGEPILLNGTAIRVGTQELGGATLPAAIAPGSKAAASLAGHWNQSGDFFLEADMPNPFELVDQILGQRIRGWVALTTAQT
ncbi:MAG: hypothetical protein ACO33E_00110 [Aquiluna sp.]